MNVNIKGIIVSAAFILYSYSAIAGEHMFERTDVMENLISLDMPASFTRLTQDEIRHRYPVNTNSRLSEVYINEETNDNFVFVHTLPKFPESRIETFAREIKEKFPKVAMKTLDATDVVVNGKKAVLVDAGVKGTQHTYMLALSVDGHLLMATFTAQDADKKMLKLGRESLLSIKVNH